MKNLNAVEGSISSAMLGLKIEMKSLDREISEQETRYNKLELVLETLEEAYNDLTEIDQ